MEWASGTSENEAIGGHAHAHEIVVVSWPLHEIVGPWHHDEPLRMIVDYQVDHLPSPTVRRGGLRTRAEEPKRGSDGGD